MPVLGTGGLTWASLSLTGDWGKEISYFPLPINRRQFLRWGLLGVGVAGSAAYAGSQLWRDRTSAIIPPLPDTETPSDQLFDPMTLLRDFDYGTVKQENGQNIREFEVTANSHRIQLNAAIPFVTWSLNGRVPGPTLRATEGD